MEFETLVDKLDQESKHLLEQGVATASSRTHFAVEPLHLILQFSQASDSDINQLLNRLDCNCTELHSQALSALEQEKTGNGGFPKISPDIVRLLFDAWMLATSDFQQTHISTAHITLALLESEALRLSIQNSLPAIMRIKVSELRDIITQQASKPAAQHNGSPLAGGQSNLAQYTVNLTADASSGKIESIVGRDHEVRQIIDILSRKKQNNPILTGEAGVGKTAVVEGLALKIAQGNVPDSLRDVQVHTLDMGLLQAGAGVKGEFENRLKGVIKEVQSSETPIILFIDEAHTLIGAGNQSGAGDAANLLKPALARGELRTIAATTWAEYKKYFESDAALTRRFQVVKVDEPTPDKAIAMLRHIAPSFERHHNVIVLDEAIKAAVNLSHRYISGRQLPDKCVSLLDTACARVNLSLSTLPAPLEIHQAQLNDIEQEIVRLTKESKTGRDHSAALAELKAQKISTEAALKTMELRWQEEKSIVDSIAALQQAIEESDSSQTIENHQQAIKQYRDQLQALTDGTPLLHECVSEEIVAQIVADWTGIPVGKMSKDEIGNVIALQSFMEARVIGQNHGLKLIADAIKTSRAGLADPNRPVGVFMLVGPSGVGKTETALALAEQLYGSDKLVNVINMSEFKEEHKVSMLLGAPPGYVGYGQGGVLTEAIRRNPYSVLLLDEMEKAHPGVHDIFYQVFDKGIIKDGEGRDIDFKNTVIIMTSNCASDEITQLCDDIDTAPEPEQLLKAINPTLRQTFKPAFLGRSNIIPYYPLSSDNLKDIITLKLQAIRKRVFSAYNAEIIFEPCFFEWIISQCDQSDTGARQIDLILNNTFLPQLSEKILSLIGESNTFVLTTVTIDENNKILHCCPVKDK